jgi:quinol monooxygenase YgiN
MAEVHVLAKFLARKGKEDELRALLQGMLVPTRAEPGCITYDLYESSSKGHFYFWERWKSQSALDQHIATPHFSHLRRESEKSLQEPFEVHLLTGISAGVSTL